MMELVKDLGMVQISEKVKKRIGIYECGDCKTHFEARTETVKARNQERCNSCASKLRAKKHGMRNHPLNNTINNMIQRCENPKTGFYSDYGGRGIKVCEEWRHDREAFFKWALANGWEEDLSIDRIDVDKDYSPSNCRFTTQSIQAQNTRPLSISNKSGYRGVNFNQSKQKWEANITVEGTRTYLGTFHSAEEAAQTYITYVKENNLEHNYGIVEENLEKSTKEETKIEQEKQINVAEAMREIS